MSTVPSSVSQAQSGMSDVSQQLDKIFSENTQELQKLAIAATTPVAGGHATAVPSSLMQPPTEFQGAPLDHREVVGAGNARAQGIGNSITATLNTIGAVRTTLDNKKKVEIASSTQQLVTAQQAADQAKQIMASNPDQNSDAYKQAKEAYDHNTQIQGTILTGKHGKDIMKGFNIDYTDPSANKTIQHDAVAMGKARAAAAEKFNKGTPTTMAPDPQAIARYSSAMAQQKAKLDMMKDYMTFQASVYRSDRTVDAAKVREIGAGMLQTARFQQQQEMLNQRYAQAEKMRGEHFSDSVKLIYERAGAARQTAADIFKDKESDPLNMYTKTRTAASTYSKNAINDGNTLVALQQARLAQYVDSKGNQINEKNVNQQAVKDIDAQIQYVKMQQQIDQANSKNFMDQATRLRNTFGLAETPEDSGTGSFDSQSDSVGGGEPDYTDPLYYSGEQGPQ